MVCMLLPTATFKTKAAPMEEVVTTVDDADIGTDMNQFQYTGWWQAETGISTDYNGTEHWSNKGKWKDTPPSITLRFKGNKVEVFGKKENVGGIYKAVLDGDNANAVEIDTYNPTVQNQERLYMKEGLSEGEHTLTLTVLKKMNAMGGTYENVNVGAVIDYAKVYAMEEVNPDKTYLKVIDDTDSSTNSDMFKIQYKGSGWQSESGFPDLFYKGTDHYSNNADATYEMRFIGSSVEIIGSKNTAHADYTVFIDDKAVGEALAKLPSGAAQHQQSLFKKDDLTEGEHTLKVARKEGSSGAMQVDALKVNHKAIAPTGIAFDKPSLSIEAGLQDQVKAIQTPDYATMANITYSIADSSIATITQDGEITALKAGTTSIHAAIAGTALSASIALTVLPQGMPMKASVGTIYEHATQDDYKKVLDAGKTTWNEVAWRGDILNSKIDIATKKAVHQVKLSASEFKNGNAVIPSSAIEIHWLKDTMANIGRGNGGAPVKPFPDIIHKSGTMDIDAKRVQSAWIDINIPKDAKPGIYSGTMSLTSDEVTQPITFAYTFEVIDLEQPDVLDTSTEVQIWQHPFAVASYYGVEDADLFTEEHFQYMRPSMKEYKELGGHDIVANIVEEAWNHQSYTGDPSMVKWIKKKDGTFTYDYDWFDKWVKFNIDEGIIDPARKIGQIKCYSIVPWGNQIAYFDEATQTTKKVSPATGSEQWIAMWKPFLNDFMKHTKEKGWFDITYIAMDERGMQDLKNSVDLIESVKGDDGKSFKISSAFNYSSGTDYSFLDRINDISIDLSHINDASQDMRKMSAHRKELGLTTTIYTCTGDYPSNYTISNMSDNAWTMWYSLSQNTDGFMRWAWDNWVADPLENVTYKYWEPGDGWFIYPVEKGTKSDTYFYKTPRYELLKQGVRDINKAKYLMEHSDVLKPQIDALVKSLKRPNKGNNGYGSAVAATPEDAALTGSEVDRMRSGVMQFAREYVASKTIPVTSIETDKQDVSMDEGDSVSVKATVKPDNATNKEVEWKSEDVSIATVDNKGVITGIKAGKTSIIVSDVSGHIKTTINVVVKAKRIPVTTIEVSKKKITLTPLETLQIKTRVLPDNATDKRVRWHSFNTAIATVQDGNITAVRAGSTTVRVSTEDGKIYQDIQVIVKDKSSTAETSIHLSSPDGTIEVVGKLHPDTKMLAEMLSIDSLKINDPAFMKNYQMRKAFHIGFTLNGKPMTLTSPVEVTVKVDPTLLKQNIQLAYIGDDGKVIFVDMKKQKDAIVFETAYSGNFVITTKMAPQQVQSVHTGDSTALGLFMVSCILSGAFLFIIKRKKCKNT